ncbi:MAG: hypothetical protein MJZ13_05950 [Bacteroidales bacterium]|nr:hypothetical protein [Bacteroidales bacterium]
MLKKTGCLTLLDCFWCELYGFINGAEIDDQAISHEHASIFATNICGTKISKHYSVTGKLIRNV